MNGKTAAAVVVAALVGLAVGAHWSSQEAEPGPDAEGTALLEAQAAAWNAGDLDGFMKGYWESEELTYHSPKGVLKGYDTLRKHYQEAYGKDRKGMGKLTFSDLTVRSLGGRRAWARGKWNVEW